MFENLNKRQTEHLDFFKPCTIRTVFLEKSFLASDDVLAFLNYYKNEAVFILESIPGIPKQFVINSTQAMFTQRNIRFMNCYVIFYFQDQLRAAAANYEKEYLPLKLLILIYFQKFTTFSRNENPHFVVFISFKVLDTADHYTYIKYITTTSSFYVFSLDGARLICYICGYRIFWEVNNFSDSTWRKIHVKYGAQMSVTNQLGYRWDAKQVNFFYGCEIFPHRLTFLYYPDVDDCFLREFKQHLNITDSREAQGFYNLVQFLLMGKGNVNSKFLENAHARYEALPYGMVIDVYQFGTLTSPNNHDISSLTKPFDVVTWSFLIGSIFFVCLYFRIVFELTKKRSVLETHINQYFA